ncbi:ribonuclease H-like domain-containing protein [Tanacetum coccineum]
MFLCQKKYAAEVLERAGMRNCHSCRTIVIESKLGADSTPGSDPTLYRSLDVALQYLTFTRPDLSYAVQQLYSSFISSLVAYSDADYACCPTTRRSTSGYYVFLGNNLLSWSSKRHYTLSRSSAEADYRGAANVVDEHQRMKHIEIDIHFVRDQVAIGHVRVLNVHSRYHYADIFTKGLSCACLMNSDKFERSASSRSNYERLLVD